MRKAFTRKLKENGITLIALVITIIILLILAGVTIGALAGENGILRMASEAKKQGEIEEEKEAIKLAYSGAMAKNYGSGIDYQDLNNQFELNERIDANAIGANPIKVIFDSGRVYEIDENGNISEGKIGKTDGTFDEVKGVNTPELGNNMKLVIYDEKTKEWIPDETNSAYSYIDTSITGNENRSEWANAKVTIKGVESYFVWIPRYEYKIDDVNKIIDVKFIPTTKTTADEGYIIHPAFTTDIENGGWKEELSGIWVGKYEVSRTDAGTTVDDTGSSEIIQVRPNVTSWRSMTIGEMYDKAKEYSQELQSHMLKNSEWGAVAYLTHSKYGRNGTEVTINNNSNYLTGNAGDSVDAGESTETHAYNTPKGVLASSTGNVSGIYDLSGGAWEYVTAYYSGSSNLSNGRQLVNETNREYVTAYDGTDVETDYKIGDATKETKGWNGDTANFVGSDLPFFDRGGFCGYSSSAGVFYFCGHDGNSSSSISFRVCLAV